MVGQTRKALYENPNEERVNVETYRVLRVAGGDWSEALNQLIALAARDNALDRGLFFLGAQRAVQIASRNSKQNIKGNVAQAWATREHENILAEEALRSFIMFLSGPNKRQNSSVSIDRRSDRYTVSFEDLDLGTRGRGQGTSLQEAWQNAMAFAGHRDRKD